MKNLLSIALLLMLSANGSFAQYIVTKVSGRVKTSDGKYIKPGSQLKPDDKLQWSTMQDKLYVVVVGKGEKIIAPSAAAAAGNNVYTELLLSALHQTSRSGSLSGRGEIIEHIPDALKTYAASNGKIIIEDENKFLFNPATYPQENGSTFFVEIDAPLKSPVIRPVNARNDTLIINYTDLATETSNPNIKYSLGYYDKSNGTSKLVTTFAPYFDKTNEMETLIASTIQAYQGTDQKPEQVRDSVYRSLYAASGKPNGILFVQLFNKYWQNKGVMEINRTPVTTGGDFDQNLSDAVPQLSLSVEVSRSDLPSNFSLYQYTPPVGDQGAYSSCTAWSTAYAARTISYAVKHGYSKTNHYDKLIANTFSPDFIYNNIKQPGDCGTGTYIPTALTFMKTRGNIVTLGNSFTCGKTYQPDDIKQAKNYMIKNFNSVYNRKMTNAQVVSRIKSSLIEKQPLVFGMKLPDSFGAVDQSGIWNPYPEESAKIKLGSNQYGGHAMCIIGYDDNLNGGSFEIMNSWGAYRAKKGFYWINYNDFCAFVTDVYCIDEYDDQPAVAVVQPKVETPEVITPVVNPVKTILPEKIKKPMLTGELTFMLQKNDGSMEGVPVNKNAVDTRGQSVVADGQFSYANFILAQPFYSGNHYKIQLGLGQPAYVYVLNIDGKGICNALFPQQKNNESALINFSNATLFLPDADHSFQLDNTIGKEKMCVLVSKSPVDIDEITRQCSGGGCNLYTLVRNMLGKRLMEAKTSRFNNDKISFNTEVNDTDVLSFFIEMNHL